MPGVNKHGTVPAPINWNLVRSLFELHCTIREVCHVLKVDDETLHKAANRELKCSLNDLKEECYSVAKASLRRTMFQKATVGKDTKMMIFLAKNLLKYSDNPNTIQSFPDNIKITVERAKK